MEVSISQMDFSFLLAMCKQLAGKPQRARPGAGQRGARREGQGGADTERAAGLQQPLPPVGSGHTGFCFEKTHQRAPHCLSPAFPLSSPLEPWLGRSQPAGRQESGYIPFTHKRLCTGLPSLNTQETPGQYQAWEVPPQYHRRKPSATCLGPQVTPGLAHGRSAGHVAGAWTSGSVRTHTAVYRRAQGTWQCQ